MSYAIKKDGQGWRAIDSKDDCLDDEKFSKNKPEEIIENPRIDEIKYRFLEINYESIRPLRAVLSGKYSDQDRQKIDCLENEAIALRLELAEIKK